MWSARRLVREIREEWGRGRLRYINGLVRRHLGRLLIGIGFVALATMTIVLTVLEGPIGAWLLVFSPVAVMWLSLAIGAVSATALGIRATAGAMIDGMLGARRCPVCDYDLAALPVRHGEILECPECGGGWQSERLGRDRPLERPVVIVRFTDDPPAG